ncbi:nuA3 HAT complex component nto1 [Mortierella sp. AM989]|nr:nuA3 HAT complex component nto1 [Mortierella sp. AM989]
MESMPSQLVSRRSSDDSTTIVIPQSNILTSESPRSKYTERLQTHPISEFHSDGSTPTLNDEQLHAIVGQHLVLTPSSPGMGHAVPSGGEGSDSGSSNDRTESSPSPVTTPEISKISVEGNAIESSSATRDSHFRLQGGADANDVYKWHLKQTRPKLGSRSYTYNAPQDKDSAMSTIKAPGGFRRHFIKQDAFSRGDPAPQLPSNSFIHFLGLFSMYEIDHFAGEDLRATPRHSIVLPKGSEKRQSMMSDMFASKLNIITEDELQEEDETINVSEEKISFSQAVGMLFKTFIASGILFLPNAFKNGGIVFAPIFMTLVAVLCLHSFLLLVKCRELHPGSYGDIGQHFYGRWMRYIVLFAITISQFGFCCGYCIFFAQQFAMVVDSLGGAHLDKIVWIAIFFVILVPFTMVRNIGKLGFSTLVADLCIIVGLIYLYVNDIKELVINNGSPTPLRLFNSDDFGIFVGTAVFSYEGIGMVIPICGSMANPKQFPRALTIVLSAVCVLLVSFGSLGYAAYGDNVQTIILDDLPHQTGGEKAGKNAIQLLYLIAVFLTTPLMLFPCIRIVEQVVFKIVGDEPSAKARLMKENTIRIVIDFAVAAVAYAGYSKLDIFISNAMPHNINPPAPVMPRLEPPESDNWYAKVKRSSTGIRKGRIKSHRKGRPPGSGNKNRLKQQELLSALDQAASDGLNRDQHFNTLANQAFHTSHSSSTRHDYGGDDESKPREERSYLEFFPFLNTSLRLEIVDAAQERRSQVAESSHKNDTEVAKDSEVKAEGGDVEMATINSGTDDRQEVDQSSNTVEIFHDPIELANESSAQNPASGVSILSSEESALLDTNRRTDIGFDENLDGDAASDRDEFFDAKGFIDSEAESSQKPSIQPNNRDSGKAGDSTSATNGDGSEAINIGGPLFMSTIDVSTDADSDAGNARDFSILDIQDLNLGHISQGSQETKDIAEQLSIPAPVKFSSTTNTATNTLEPKTPMSLLPKSSFRLIPREDDDLEEYHLPAGHNVRYIEPTETELAERVEYDMDEQDEFWLKEINVERRKQDLGEVTASMFEKIIDRLEKEWFDLTKNIPKSTENLPPEDSACNICDDGECENSNAIVFCDGCNLAVHQDCYGIPYIPEGQWLCRKCMLSPQMPVSCIFCPGEGGAFKQTTNSRWAHLLCAGWIPEVGVANTVYMEPIDNIDKIPASRWKLTCYICKLRMGACIQCETKNCFRAFHVTCARKAHLYMKSKVSKVSNSGGEVIVHRAHCHKHTPRDYKGVIDIASAAALFAHKGIKKKRTKIRILDDDSDDPDYGRSDDEMRSVRRQSLGSGSDKGAISTSSLAMPQSLGGTRTSKAALAHQKHYTPGAPLAPMFIVNRLLPFVSKLGTKSQAQRKASALNFVYTICKYWSLKRESRRGAPLLKRLHLEPWTASASAHRQTEEEKLKKLQTQVLLRGDLEKVRMLAELVRKRERAKLKRQELQNRYLCRIMFPLKTILEDTLAELEKLDRQKYFAYPISAEEVKDYHDVIKDPICFQTMNEKLASHKYQTIEEFSDDARRIYHNCLTYNKVDTPYYRAASRQSKQAEPLLQQAKADYERLEINPQTGFLAVPIDPEIFTYNLVPFQKSEDDEDHSVPDARVAADDAPSGSSLLKTKGREPSIEPPAIPFVTGRSLRATVGRAAHSISTAQQSPQDIRRGLNSTPGFRSPTRSGLKPEVPKLKTATLTRADIAKARQAGNDGSAEVKLDEEELLEKLKLKSKKSRSLAVSLQSRLKPSIVSKVVEVINKPAPKGWAYVVVEGEEDTTEGEDEGEPSPIAMDAEAQELAKAKEEASLRRREERIALALKKKLAKEKKVKARAEAYARAKAEKALVATTMGDTTQSSVHQSNISSIGGGQSSRGSLPEPNKAIQTNQMNQDSGLIKAKLRRAQVNHRPKVSNGSLGVEVEPALIKQSIGEIVPVVTQVTEKTKNNNESAQSDQKVLPFFAPRRSSRGTDQSDRSDNINANGAPPVDSNIKGKGKQIIPVEDTIIERFESRDFGDTDGDKDTSGASKVESEMDIPTEDGSVATEEEPPRKRQKRPLPGRVITKDALEDESSTSTRRLRSNETTPQIPASLGQRRGSSVNQRGATKLVGDTAAIKRRRSESSEGSPKKSKSDRQGGPLSYGSLVWAKMEGFPWFPAELMDPKSPHVPAQALEAKKDGHGVHLVQFFDLRERGDRGRSWYWVATAQILPLGVDLDEDRKRAILKTGWNPRRRKSVKQAYFDACQLKGIDANIVLAEST